MLGVEDAVPVEIINPEGRSPFVLTGEHAGRVVPKALGDLGLEPRHLERHIAWDIGVDGLARRLSTLLDAPLVIQRYSRLVIDCNRPLEAEDAVPETSDGTAVPANKGLDKATRQARYDAIHKPFHDTVAALLDARAAAGKPAAVVAVHSFTPMMESLPEPRPWDLGLLYNRHPALTELVSELLNEEASGINHAHNQPYEVSDIGDYTVPVHGEKRGLPSILLEVRNDHIAAPPGQMRWAELLGRVFGLAEGRLPGV